jgi:hypothetical protein
LPFLSNETLVMLVFDDEVSGQRGLVLAGSVIIGGLLVGMFVAKLRADVDAFGKVMLPADCVLGVEVGESGVLAFGVVEKLIAKSE